MISQSTILEVFLTTSALAYYLYPATFEMLSSLILAVFLTLAHVMHFISFIRKKRNKLSPLVNLLCFLELITSTIIYGVNIFEILGLGSPVWRNYVMELFFRAHFRLIVFYVVCLCYTCVNELKIVRKRKQTVLFGVIVFLILVIGYFYFYSIPVIAVYFNLEEQILWPVLRLISLTVDAVFSIYCQFKSIRNAESEITIYNATIENKMKIKKAEDEIISMGEDITKKTMEFDEGLLELFGDCLDDLQRTKIINRLCKLQTDIDNLKKQSRKKFLEVVEMEEQTKKQKNFFFIVWDKMTAVVYTGMIIITFYLFIKNIFTGMGANNDTVTKIVKFFSDNLPKYTFGFLRLLIKSHTLVALYWNIYKLLNGNRGIMNDHVNYHPILAENFSSPDTAAITLDLFFSLINQSRMVLMQNNLLVEHRDPVNVVMGTVDVPLLTWCCDLLKNVLTPILFCFNFSVFRRLSKLLVSVLFLILTVWVCLWILSVVI